MTTHRIRSDSQRRRHREVNSHKWAISRNRPVRTRPSQSIRARHGTDPLCLAANLLFVRHSGLTRAMLKSLALLSLA